MKTKWLVWRVEELGAVHEVHQVSSREHAQAFVHVAAQPYHAYEIHHSPRTGWRVGSVYDSVNEQWLNYKSVSSWQPHVGASLLRAAGLKKMRGSRRGKGRGV